MTNVIPWSSKVKRNQTEYIDFKISVLSNVHLNQTDQCGLCLAGRFCKHLAPVQS